MPRRGPTSHFRASSRSCRAWSGRASCRSRSPPAATGRSAWSHLPELAKEISDAERKLAALKRQREAKSTTDPEKEYEQKIARLMEEDEERKRKRKEAKLEKKKKEREEREREEEENKQDVDEDLMAAMGFSGFGGSAK